MGEVPVSRLAAIIIIVLLLGGCARSQPPNYYVLNSIQYPESVTQAAGSESDSVIAVGPVRIADYLDRPQMVSRSSTNGLQFAEFDKWAEPLEKNLNRVLADNLSALVPSQRVFIYPAKPMPVQYQIPVEIIHLEKAAGEKVILDANWDILADDGEKLLMTKRTKLTLPVESSGFEGVVSAESRAVEALSREIAAALNSLPRDAIQ